MEPTSGLRGRVAWPLLLVTLLVSAGCTGDGDDRSASLPFRTVAQDAPVGSTPSAPTVFVASEPAQALEFTDLLTAEDRHWVEETDYASQVLVAVFAGTVGGGGWRITVVRLADEDGLLRVVARQGAVASAGIAAFTSPYHVVQVPRSAFGGTIPRRSVLLDQAGDVLASSGSTASPSG